MSEWRTRQYTLLSVRNGSGFTYNGDYHLPRAIFL